MAQTAVQGTHAKFARKGSIHMEDEEYGCPVAIDENTPDGRIIAAITDDLAAKLSERRQSQIDRLLAEEFAKKQYARKGSIHADDDEYGCPVAIDEETPDGRVISAETDDMKQKHAAKLLEEKLAMEEAKET